MDSCSQHRSQYSRTSSTGVASMPARRHTKDSKDVRKEFDALFTQQYGASRWERLRAALAKDVSHVALMNCFASIRAATSASTPSAAEPLRQWHTWGAAACYTRVRDEGPYNPPDTGANGLKTHYWLDAASVLPPLLLAPQPGDRVLDMCAAPGGKSLLLAMQVFGPTQHTQPPAPPASATSQDQSHTHAHRDGSSAAQVSGQQGVVTGRLTVNEVDTGRATRLRRVLQEYLPHTLLSSKGPGNPPCVRVCQHHAEQYWNRQEQEQYQAVLIDVPCSSERHVLQQSLRSRGQIAASEWSTARCTQLADSQLQLLLAGLKALQTGGRLVYSTCSLARVENDGVIERMLFRVPAGTVRVCKPLDQQDGWTGSVITTQQLTDMFGAEPTEHGFLVLPDTRGFGPMYVACMTKVADNKAMVGAHAKLGAVLLSPADDDTSDAESESEECLDGGAGEGVAGLSLRDD